MQLRKGLRASVLAVTLLIMGVAGCSSATADNAGPSNTGPSQVANTPESSPSTEVGGARGGPVPDAGPSVCEVGQSRDAMGACAPCPDLEGCYADSSGMQHFADQVIPLIVEYSDWQYEAMPAVTSWMYIPTGMTGTMACVKADGSPDSSNDMTYAYCPADNIVYLGQESLWRYYTEAGDAGAAVGIAHEWGHHVQSMVGVKQVVDMSDQLYGIMLENQADCIAGSWFAHVIERGLVNQDDLGDVDKVIAMIADLETDESRTHGTVKERSDWFIAGMRGGMTACNAAFPATPVITG